MNGAEPVLVKSAVVKMLDLPYQDVSPNIPGDTSVTSPPNFLLFLQPSFFGQIDSAYRGATLA